MYSVATGHFPPGGLDKGANADDVSITDRPDERKPVSEDYRHLFPVSWEEMHRNARALSWRLAEQGPWKGIIAIARGGLVPAQIVGRELEVRLIDTICIASYDDQTRRTPEVLKSVDGDGEGWLIVDDLVDTGRTGRIVREMLPKAHFATVYAKPQGREIVDSFVTEVSQDTWILLPWDQQPQFVQPIAAQPRA